MDSALKQRLLGAAVLIALAIIFVPMFLGNSPHQPDNSTLNLDIPKPPEHDFQTRTLPVAGADAAANAAQANPDKVVTVDTHAAPVVDAHPENSPAAPTTMSTPKSAPAGSSRSAPNPAEPVKPTPPSAPAAVVPSGNFAVHLGVYADRGHADALVKALKKRGFTAYDESTEYQGKPALRVRVGPYADRAAAETARLAIKRVEPKVPGSVIEAATAQPTADAPASALPAARAGGWAVQLGAFKSEAEANKLRDRLRGAAFAGFVERSGSGDATLWKVRAGPYADRSGADKARATIDTKLKVKGMIVTQP
ncbi:MAG: SPOR domain-containing protein [Rudaea sp.]